MVGSVITWLFPDTAANLEPSTEDAIDAQFVTGALVFVQAIPELVET